MEERNIFLKIAEDRFDRFLSFGMIDSVDFLTLEEQSTCDRFVKSHISDGVCFYGGYADAERRLIVFMPAYTGVRSEDDVNDFFSANPEESPLEILRVRIPKQEKVELGHRDYLGALMGMGIKREKVGDIIVLEDGAQIIIKKEISKYLLENFGSVGRAMLTVELENISMVDSGSIKKIDVRLNVSSPRLDNVISSVFGISRKDAVFAISKGIVFVSGREVNKPDYQIKDGEKLVLRGKGKAIYNGVVGTSKKGKSYISVTKYV